MSGHSKWSQIKHKKAINDSKKGKAFTKLLKEITMAAREGGGDPAGNARLRFLLEKGRAINMPLDNAHRAIKKGTGELPGQAYEAITYEGYGPAGIAIIIDVLTDNRNKAIAEMRHVFSRKGGSLGETNSVNWMFERAGVIHALSSKFDEDSLLEALLEYPVNDIKLEDGTFIISTNPKNLDEVKQALIDIGFEVKEAELDWLPKNTIELSAEQEEKALDFLGALEELDDVQNVYTNLG